MTEDEATSAYYTAIDAVTSWKRGATLEGVVRELLIVLLMRDIITPEELLKMLHKSCQDY